jgi:galactitol-specific phosphotransferase system IIB component
MRAVTAIIIVCLSACGTSTALEQALEEQDNWRGRQAQLDAQAIMAGMDQARIRAAVLARMGR